MAKQITELTDGLKKLFVVKCAKMNIKQRIAVIELINLWVKGKVKIPSE